MTQYKYDVTPILDELERKLSGIDDLSTEQVETIIDETLRKSLRTVSDRHKPAWRNELSRIFHPDRRSEHRFLQIFSAKEAKDLPQKTLGKISIESIYNPISFLFDVNARLNELGLEVLKIRPTKDGLIGLINDMNQLTKNKFPDLFLYREYPEIIQYPIFLLALITNIVLCMAGIISYILTWIITFLKAPEISWLNLISDQKYAAHEAYLLTMKINLSRLNLDIHDDTNETDIEDLFNTHVLRNTKEGQKNLILEAGSNNDSLDQMNDQEFDMLFKRIFIFAALKNPLVEEAALLKNDMSIIQMVQAMKSIHAAEGSIWAAQAAESSTLDQVNWLFTGVSVEVINEIYSTVKNIQAEQLQTENAWNKYLISGLLPYFSILSETWTQENEPFLKRLAQVLAMLLLTPLIFTTATLGYCINQRNLFFIAIKMISVGLINTPIYAKESVQICLNRFFPPLKEIKEKNEPTFSKKISDAVDNERTYATLASID